MVIQSLLIFRWPLFRENLSRINMSSFRIAGLNYVQYSNIAARMLRRALKPEKRAEAAKREESHVRITPWKDGKPATSGEPKPKA